MPLATPPQLSTARSASTHSMLVLDRMDAHSPGAKPSDIRPPAISRTASAALGHGVPEHGGDGVAREHVGACGLDVIEVPEVRHLRLSPGLLFLPAPLSAYADIFHPKVELLDVVLLAQALAAVFHHDAAVFQHIAVVRCVERHVGVLLHQQDGGAALA